jgi:hypothetical protein
MNRDFPEEGLCFRIPAKRGTFCCQEENLHWSTEISDADGRRPLDAAQFTWEEKLEIRETLFSWRFTLRGSNARVFVDGGSEGLRGNIEVFQLPGAGPFYLALSPAVRSDVQAWGQSACRDFRTLAVRSGLPQGWTLHWSSGIEKEAPPCRNCPALSAPSHTRLLIRSGIRASRRNWFLPFGLPELVLEAPSGVEKVTCAGLELQCEGNTYRLPPEVPKEQQLYAEASGTTEVIRSQPFYVIADFTWQWNTPLLYLDKFGTPTSSWLPHEGGVAGASVAGFSIPRVVYSPHPSCFERRRVFFVGREPGQIISWPAEPLPTSWQPVWAIPLERKGRAIFCGTDIQSSEPLSAQPGADRKKLKLWKEVLYRMRERISPPLLPRLARIWKKFQEAARHA